MGPWGVGPGRSSVPGDRVVVPGAADLVVEMAGMVVPQEAMHRLIQGLEVVVEAELVAAVVMEHLVK